MIPKISLREALETPQLLGGALPGPTWKPWRTLLLAAMGEKLTPDEQEIFTGLTGRNVSPAERVSELCCVVGRRGGKSTALSVLSVYIAALCEHPALRPGETGVCLQIALDKDQAGIDLKYALGVLQTSPLLRGMVKSKTDDSIVLSNGIEITARSPSFRRLRGRTAVSVMADECAFWFEADRSTNPDIEIVASVRPMLATTAGMLILASSAYRKSGILYDTWRRHYGKQGDADTLVALGTSMQFNPGLPAHVVEREMQRDPEMARAEYKSEWRDDIQGFVTRDLVERCVEIDVVERPFQIGTTYSAFTDVAGGSGGDSYTLAIAHRHGDRVILDLLREVKSPFSPSDVTNDFAAILKRYRIASVRGDRYAAEWVTEAWRSCGIRYRPSERSKSEIYRDFLPLLNTQEVVLLDDARCVGQLASLERRVRFGGKGESIDHPPRLHDDVANACAGACVHVKSSRVMAREWDSGRRAPQVITASNSSRAERLAAQKPPEFSKREAGDFEIVKAPRISIGQYGHSIELDHVGNDGRERWKMLDPFGGSLGLVWGKEAAMAAIERIISLGTTNGF